ncbi:hypothetical protein U9M48_000918 [Paspalum notatum var. saurae]|uniref:AAA+ ATPase domain-containing protein n=1 Tax=Paspalum notatum var. saurae TaxID=547442 RepID=A0AAQ3SEV0_PASNO
MRDIEVQVRKQIKRIQGVLTDTKESDLLDQKNSSSTGKETDKEGSSSSSKQKEIDELYRCIEHKVFGRDKDRKRICRMLREGPYSVIVMHGITGSGKSTLAQYVCNYEKDAGHFNPIMFIHVRKTFSLGDIFRDMLEQINQNRPSNDKNLKNLKKELQEELKDKCFLLVLDDLWPVNGEDPQERAILLDVLNDGRSGSRILVTAQTNDAALGLGAQEQILIPDLEEEEYLNLFMHHALQGAVDDDGRFERIGKSIAKKLHRSPIAAIAVGRRLQAEKSISFWETTANLDVLNRTMGALWWSHQQLGVDTRRCFQYCSTYPKGYKLNRDVLIRSWIAHGFASTSNATGELEDVGQRYLEELVKFSFLQVGRSTFDIETFTVHELLHELAEKVAGSDFFRIDDLSVLPAKDISPDGMGNLIRLRNIRGLQSLFNIGRMKQLEQLNELRGLLSIGGLQNVGSKEEALEADLASKKRVTDLVLCFDVFDVGTKNPDIEAEVLEGLCPPKYLQELTIKGYKGSRYPSWMLSGQQHTDAPKHLRKLVLKWCSCPLASFPEDSELFINLLELEIVVCEWDSLPGNMERLVSLQSLHIYGHRHNKMVLLPTLPRSLRKISISKWNFMLENMEHLVSLKSLSISRCKRMKFLPTLPQSLKKIQISCCGVLSRTCQEEGHENWQKIQHQQHMHHAEGTEMMAVLLLSWTERNDDIWDLYARMTPSNFAELLLL